MTTLNICHNKIVNGVVQDLATLGTVTRERGILLHADAAQGAGKLPIDLRAWPVDLMSFSAHKLYGPKGIGALYVRQRPNRVRLEPLLYGGGQERGLRAGTLPTHQIVAMGEAFRIASAEMATEQVRIRELRDRLWRSLTELGDVELNGHPARNVAGILNVSFAGITAEALLAALPEIAVSTGSACASAGGEPSHVLRAMGCGDVRARGAVRFSLGRRTTAEEIAYTAASVRAAVSRLRELSPLWECHQRGFEATVDWRASP